MERRQKVELFEQIRREHEFGGQSIRALAEQFGVHRRMVRQALKCALPPERKRPVRMRPRLDQVRAFIDGILEADRQEPRKQRHTAHRIHERIGVELPSVIVAERTVRQYVRARKRELGLLGSSGRDVAVPQEYLWGVEAQVDWYEAVVEVAGQRQTAQVFALRSMASGAAFHRAYPRATQQAFLEAHEAAFAYFGGVFQRLRYDNLSSAVKRILRGSQREETVRFIAFRSHWHFASSFCTPGRGQEKGGVEGEVGRFRRNHLVPVPVVADWAALNAHLQAAYRRDEARHIAERAETVGAAMQIEQSHLLPLQDGFELAEESFCTVDGKGCIQARTNFYSTPLRVGTRCRVRVLPATVEVWHERGRVAVHERCYGRRQQVLNLEHYLDVLSRKPGALAGSRPLRQWRAAGLWTDAYDELWQSLQQRHGQPMGTRLMIEVLQLGRRSGYERLTGAIEQALALGTHDAAAVGYLLRSPTLETENIIAPGLVVPDPASPHFGRYERPLPCLTDYDLLLESPLLEATDDPLNDPLNDPLDDPLDDPMDHPMDRPKPVLEVVS
jgi:transposase